MDLLQVGKCKYNIVRNGDIKHLCDDTCFQRFRTNPTMYLKGTLKKEPVLAPAPLTQPPTAGKGGQTGYKTCVVCQLMNINTQGQFCMWKGLDFCGENCLGKFQASLQTSCAMCTTYIPLTARSANCLRIGSEVNTECVNSLTVEYLVLGVFHDKNIHTSLLCAVLKLKIHRNSQKNYD